TRQPRKAIRPRPVNKPTPVRTRQASSGNHNTGTHDKEPILCLSDANDSSGSEDMSFFRIARPSLGQANNSVSIDSDNDDGGEREEPSARPELLDSGKSDSDSSSGSRIGRQQHNGSAEKRKLSDGSDNSEHARRQRSRSVSLTPPPEPARAASTATTGSRAKLNSAEPDIQVLDSNSDSDRATSTAIPASLSLSRRLRAEEALSLDPALQAIIKDSDAMGRQAVGPAASAPFEETTKVHVEFGFAYDEEFIVHDLPQIWEPKRWRRVSPRQRPQIVKRLDARIAVIVFIKDTMERALQAFSDSFCLNVVATDPVLMIGQMRVFPTSTMASLGIRPVYYVSVYPRSVYNRERERNALEQTRRALEDEQARRDLEMAQSILSSTHVASDGALLAENGLSAAGNEQSAQSGADKSVRIKVRDKSGKDTLLLVTSTTTVQAIIRNYISMAGLDASTSVTLEFDNERLDPSATIGDTEIEDDDMLTAIWRQPAA
ncbi:hypothetical protein GGI20_004262, partial [Coemansia sp. BCRC 34301]